VLPQSTHDPLTQCDAGVLHGNAEDAQNGNAACDRLERALSRINQPDASTVAAAELFALRSRVEAITTRWLLGSDRQTPSQAER
jgi:hypothetical protein